MIAPMHRGGRAKRRRTAGPGRRPRDLRDHRRPRARDDLPLALPARGARAARLPDRRRRVRRLDARAARRARARLDRRHGRAARRGGVRSASRSGSPTSTATSRTTRPTAGCGGDRGRRRSRSSTSRSRRRSSGRSSAGSPTRAHRRTRRVVVEKPFGHDLASARALNAELHALIDESQLYRIDHFLGKMSVEDILYLRFANTILEPVWNRQLRLVRADHDGRGLRRRRPRALLRPGRRHARRRPEPPAPGAEHGRDGAARPAAASDVDQRPQARRLHRDGRGGPGALRARPVPRLPRRRRRRAGLADGDVLRAAARDRQLALVGRAVLHPSRQVAAGDRDRGARRLQARRRGSASSRGTRRARRRTSSCCGSARGRARGSGCRRRPPRGRRCAPSSSTWTSRAWAAKGRPRTRCCSTRRMRGDSSHFARQDAVEETWRVVQPLIDSPPPVEVYEPGLVGARVRRRPRPRARTAGTTRGCRHEEARMTGREAPPARGCSASVSSSRGRRRGPDDRGGARVTVAPLASGRPGPSSSATSRRCATPTSATSSPPTRPRRAPRRRGRRALPRLLEEPRHRRDARACSCSSPRSRASRERTEAMFRGDRINVTEDRSVLHVALRMPRGPSLVVDGVDVVAARPRGARPHGRVRRARPLRRVDGAHRQADPQRRQHRDRRLRPRPGDGLRGAAPLRAPRPDVPLRLQRRLHRLRRGHARPRPRGDALHRRPRRRSRRSRR